MNATILSATLRASRACEPQVDFKIATNYFERAAAFRLTYQNYVRKGLIEPNSYQMRVTAYHLQPTTNVFVAKRQGRVIGTVTLIGDGEIGIPMDTTNPDEVRQLRERGYHIGEISCLAIDTPRLQFLPTFVGLTRLMAQHARHIGMDAIVCAAVPTHVRFYERFLGFQRIGQEQPYHTVCNTRGIACCVDFAYIDEHPPVYWNQYFADPLPICQLEGHPMPSEEAAQFRRAADLALHYVPVHA